jgi:hypothetical protein
MIPTLQISSLPNLAPRLWPMGIGAGTPVAMESRVGVPWVVTFAWDSADRLVEVQTSAKGQTRRRELYHWRGDELDRIQDANSQLDDPVDEIWTWSDGRPIRVHRVGDGKVWSVEERWSWSEDGRALELLEHSAKGTVTRTNFSLDAHGRMVHADYERAIDGAKEILDVAWSSDGRLLEARQRTGLTLDEETVVGFRWDDYKLVAQTRSDYPGIDVFTYRYQNDPA